MRTADRDPPARIMVVDDDEDQLTSLAEFLQTNLPETQIEAFTDPGKALERAAEAPVDLVLCDLRMPTMSGVTFFARLRVIRPGAFHIIVTGHGDSAYAELGENADLTLIKPLATEPFLRRVRGILRDRRWAQRLS